jgi:hypothetical protein
MNDRLFGNMQRWDIRVSRFSSWAPGLENQEDWKEWAWGNRQIPGTGKSPELAFTPPLFRRRLSQLSRMTIQVIHELLPLGERTKLVFLSFRGEITQQLNINRMLIEEGSLTPAAFSLSVFNAPIALASIALNLTAGYTAIYPGGNRFDTGLFSAAAPLLEDAARETVLVYADEWIPPQYGSLAPSGEEPLAFAVLLSRRKEGIPLMPADIPESPRDFLKFLCLYGNTYGPG